ncbi:MAG: glycosyltransferase [Chloracidobacterium sp.]|nr:glycosyltransferase [Chloracidobacterium sp.]
MPETAVLVLSSTRLSPEKNVELLPEIMGELLNDTKHDFRFLVAGAGPKEDWLRDETLKRFPGKLVLLGHLEKDALADHYANADVFVHPNPREPFGNVGLEAMASGVAMVVQIRAD